MKKFLEFAGLVGAVLGLIAFILLLATNAMVLTGALNGWYSGALVLFGEGKANLAGYTANTDAKLAWVALIGWIFILLAVLILLCLFVGSLLKIKALDKLAKLLTFVAGGLLVAAGILLFFTIPAFGAANDWNNNDGVALGAGWVIAAILAIVGGGIAILPPVLSLVKK